MPDVVGREQPCSIIGKEQIDRRHKPVGEKLTVSEQ